MEILLLSPDNPFPRESGAAIRNYGIIRGLYGSGHRVTLLTFSEGALSPGRTANSILRRRPQLLDSTAQQVRSHCVTARHKTGRYGRSLKERRFGQKLAAILDSRAFDIIQFSGIELGSYLPVIRQKRREAKVVYDALNAEAELQRLIYQLDRKRPSRLHTALYSAIQARRLERYERKLCESVDAVIAVSEEDRNLLESYGGSPIYVMPSGIFVDDYQSCHGERRAGNQLVFTGKMDYRPNVDAVEWFCHSVLPALLQRHPALELIIVGRNPHPRIQALADGKHVKVTGWVESVLPYLQAATLFVLPMRMGSGTRLKILEAMASGCAVVSTSLGASGLRGSIRQAIEIADGAEGFAHSISTLLNDMDRRQALGERAREQARAHYDWSAIMRHLLDAYEDLGLG